MNATMGHFIGWKFGVPVRVLDKYNEVVCTLRYLIHEYESGFVTIDKHGSRTNWIKGSRPDYGGYSYELIPYSFRNFNCLRYPVCSSRETVAYCNAHEVMDNLTTIRKERLNPKIEKRAILEIDGERIELSNETTEQLKKQLGVNHE